MPDGMAYLFREWVTKELVKVEQEKARRKEKGKKRAQVITDDEDGENMPPSTST